MSRSAESSRRVAVAPETRRICGAHPRCALRTSPAGYSTTAKRHCLRAQVSRPAGYPPSAGARLPALMSLPVKGVSEVGSPAQDATWAILRVRFLGSKVRSQEIVSPEVDHASLCPAGRMARQWRPAEGSRPSDRDKRPSEAGPLEGGSSRQGCNPAGESPAMSVARVGHVAIPHPGEVTNRAMRGVNLLFRQV